MSISEKGFQSFLDAIENIGEAINHQTATIQRAVDQLGEIREATFLVASRLGDIEHRLNMIDGWVQIISGHGPTT